MPTERVYDDGFPAPRRWNARWVWTDGDGQDKNAYCYFRTEFERPEDADELRLYISADTRYQLFLNGEFVGRGVPPCRPYFQYYDEHDLSDRVRSGTNCIGVIVNHVGNSSDTRGGLVAELVDGDDNTRVATGPDWSAQRADAWVSDTFAFGMNVVAPYQEFFDARCVPEGWNTVGFDDSGWETASVIGGNTSDRPPAVSPWVRLVPRDIPCMTADPVLPERIEARTECLDIHNRTRWHDLSIGLSAAGRPVEHSRLEGADNLLTEDGATVVQCSTGHMDGSLDGVYDPCIVLDFGKVITAYPRLELDGVEGGIVEIGSAERLIDGRFNNAIEGQFAERYCMVDGPQTWQPFAWRAFRYLKLRFRRCQRPVRLNSLKAVVSMYPFEERGSFTSSDKELNDIFSICRHTIRLCCNESIVDTPWRERAQWLGDVSAVTLPGIYACFGDTALPGKFLRQTAACQYPTGLLASISNAGKGGWTWNHPDYSLWWVMGLWNHYLYTGEQRWVREYYPVALRVLRAHLRHTNERGLIEDMPFNVFIDWADVDRRGECAALNAIFYGALEALGRMTELTGDEHTRATVGDVMAALEENFEDRFMDPARGCLADACVAGELSPKTSEQANMAAILWGLCAEDTSRDIVRRFYEEESVDYTEAQPFFTSVVLRALDRLGRFDLALRIIRDRWGRRMLDRGATSTFEEWQTNGTWRSGEFRTIMRTHSHAWSAAPAEFLIRHLAGIEIAEPGCATLRVQPRDVDFDYEVTFPTPRGPVRVVREDGRTDVSAPDGVSLAK